MSPAAAVAALQRQLAAAGEDIVLQRYTGTGSAPLGTWEDLPVRAKVALAIPEELAAGLDLKKRRIIVSPTRLEAASWPTPKAGKDAVLIAGEKFVIQAWSPIRIGDRTVRIEAEIG